MISIFSVQHPHNPDVSMSSCLKPVISLLFSFQLLYPFSFLKKCFQRFQYAILIFFGSFSSSFNALSVKITLISYSIFPSFRSFSYFSITSTLLGKGSSSGRVERNTLNSSFSKRERSESIALLIR